MRTVISFAALAALLPLAIADAALASQVELVQVERFVEAQATSGPLDEEFANSVMPGVFDEAVSASSSRTACLPLPGGKCVVYRSFGSASQSSAVDAAADGALELSGEGAVAVYVDFVETSSAASGLVVHFAVEGSARFLLEGGGGGEAHVALAGPDGAIVWEGLPGGVQRAGVLPQGVYVFTVVAQRTLGGNGSRQESFFDFQLRVAPEEPTPGPTCEVVMDQGSYAPGEVATASVLRIDNPSSEPYPIELKVWLGLPDGRQVPARNEGAQGDLGVPALHSQDFGPLAILGITADTAPGIYEFSCRILAPVTGEILSEDRELFVVSDTP